MSSSPMGRRRLQACERCWKRKQKCDRLLPQCTTCVEAKSECRPRSVPIGSTVEEASGLSNVAVPDYIESLKRKAEDLDDQYRRQRARLDNEHHDGLSQSPAIETETPQSTTGVSHITPLTDNTSLTERSVQATMGEIGYLSRNAMAEPREETRGFPQELAISSMIKAALNISGEDPSRSLHMSLKRQKLASMVDQSPRLTKDFASQYLEGFFKHIIVYFPYIEEDQFKKHFDSFFDAVENTQAHECSAVGYFNVYMAVAIGILASSDRGIDLLAMSLHTAAMERFTKVLETSDGVDTINCMLLMIVYSMYSSSGGSAWHLVGLAMKKAVAYRFHKEPHPPGALPTEKLGRRKRLFWNLYTVDRMISCVMDRSFTIEDDDISLKYPTNDSATQPEERVELQQHILMHARLISKMRNIPSQRPVSHYGNLCYWRDIPKSLRTLVSGSSIYSRAMKQLTCRALIQLMHLSSGGLPTTVIGSTKTIERDVVNLCSQYIDSEYQCSDQGAFSGTFIDALDIFAAGVVVICVGRPSSLLATSAEVNIISRCTTLLTILGEKFAPLKALHRVLWDLQRSQDATIIEHLPDIVPSAMQIMIQNYAR